jgi:hypothetical protein
MTPRAGAGVGRSYLRVLVVWAATLAALFAFQQYFG